MAGKHKRTVPARRTEKRLVKMAGEAARNDCPNPERIGCPNSDAVQAIARRRLSFPDFDNLVDHVATCAPCYLEYTRGRLLHRLRNTGAAVLLGAAVLILGLVWRRSTPDLPPPPAAKETPRQIVAATLDFSNSTTERSNRPQNRSPDSPRLTRGWLDLIIKLPIGTEDGDYTVEFRSSNDEVVAQAVGGAAWDGTAEVLKIRTDLTAVRPGVYTVAVRSASSSRRLYTVILE